MACSSCGRARTQVTRTSSVPRASAMTNNVRTVDSQSITTKVQSAVVSNPNSTAKRTKV